MGQNTMILPELLSPAGSAPAMVAAVQCGADAVYLGAGAFNARATAENFGGELEAAVGYCHARGAKVYVTLNTMVRQDELTRLEDTVREICLSAADGVIVQDLGVARLVRQMAPTLYLHASTQMAVHNPQGVEFLVKNGFRRVVLAREMEYGEIARCAHLGAELEVFVHGALCVSCSGNCLLSGMIGGRSGNRGLCAQPCRMRYRLDEHSGYLLSTRDLCGLDGLRELIASGAASLKIEGRLKRPEYVAVTTGVYRRALDAIARGAGLNLETEKAELAQMFNRGGFTRGYGFGVEDRELMFADQPNHMGVEIGSCLQNGRLRPRLPVDTSDVLALRRTGNADRPLRSGTLANGSDLLPEARVGDRLIRLVSHAQMKRAQAAMMEHKNIPVDMTLQLHTGAPARLTLDDGTHCIQYQGDPVERAQARPLAPERVRQQMDKLGDTPFALQNYLAEIDTDAYMPVSALNQLRRIAVEKLIEARFGKPHAFHPAAIPTAAPAPKAPAKLIVQSGNAAILSRALAAGADEAVFAPTDLRTQALDAALLQLPERFRLALPPVTAADTLTALADWAQRNRARLSGVQLANIGQLGVDWPCEIIADYNFNIANAATLMQLLDWGIERYTPSVELNTTQIAALGGRRELIVYGNLPLMQLRHCPLRAVEKLAGAHHDCRRCDSCPDAARIDHKQLIDRMQAAFPLRRIATPDGCVIQVRNSALLMLLKRADGLPGAEAWRLLAEDNDPVEDLLRLHRAVLNGQDIHSDPLYQSLEQMNTTAGHYFRGVE